MRNQPMILSPNGQCAFLAIGNCRVAASFRILQNGHKGFSIQVIWGFETCQFANRWKKVECFNDGITGDTRIGDSRVRDDQRRPQGFLEEGMLSNRMLSEMPTMIPPENDRGSFPEPQFQVCRAVGRSSCRRGNACRVMLADHDGKFRIFVGIALPTVVFHEFTDPCRCFSLGFERVRRRREISWLQIFAGAPKGRCGRMNPVAKRKVSLSWLGGRAA